MAKRYRYRVAGRNNKKTITLSEKDDKIPVGIIIFSCIYIVFTAIFSFLIFGVEV